ncbi:HET-domain-containing protein [Periconia macrospinosa]|uniref:HET-domain-containing protein n=1 Tax=Periconia macrospinosa TaxID=97972 RepID=A0A2V1DJI2_9PLEO|nr:HET-domain-containing protein [Periconia macrospinosa]
MEKEKFCDPCSRLLRGERDATVSLWRRVPHHADAQSLRQALQIPCYICMFVWKNPLEIFPGDGESPDGVESNFSGKDRIVNELYFSMHGGAYGLKFIPLHDMAIFDFPRLLSTNTGSSSALDFLVRKYQECTNEHTACELLATQTFSYPSRLLDVGTMVDATVSLRGSQPLTLTQQTQASLERGFRLDLLPRTFQHAVLVTRKLGARYLWIDSLCIYQDDLHDWAIEASRMQAVYSNAACTIAATASRSSDQGLFFDRDPWLVRPRRFRATWHADVYRESYPELPPAGEFWCDHNMLWHQRIEYAPLNQRGWVAQERHLSRRIMHFAGNQLFWECRCCKASENYPDHLPTWATASHDGPDPTPLKTRVHQLRSKYAEHDVGFSGIAGSKGVLPSKTPSSEELDDLYLDWVTWRSDYSRTSVTKAGDKLVAIQGIAQDVGQISSDDFIAGVWKTRILKELCFSVFAKNTPQKIPGPSWSWATSNAQIIPGELTLYREYTYLTEVCDFVHDSDSKAMKEAVPRQPLLRVRSNLIRAEASWAQMTNDMQRHFGEKEGSMLKSFTFVKTNTVVRYDLDSIKDQEVELELDEYVIKSKDRCEDIYILVIGYHTFNFENKSRRAACLVLAPHPVLENHFERIGYLEAGTRLCDNLFAELERSDNRAITLV